MKKFDVKMLAIWSILLAMFLLVAFVLPMPKNVVFTVAIVCTAVIFGFVLMAYLAAFRKNEKLESKLLGWPIFKAAVCALCVQVVVGLGLVLAAAVCPMWAAVLIEAVIFAGSAIIMIVREAARDVVETFEQKIEDRTAAWKAIRAKAYGMPDNVREAMRYADPTPTSIDGEIAAAVDAGDAETVMKLMEQRKTLAKEEK